MRLGDDCTGRCSECPLLSHGTGTQVCGTETGEDNGLGKKSSDGGAWGATQPLWDLLFLILSVLPPHSYELILRGRLRKGQVLFPQIPPGLVLHNNPQQVFRKYPLLSDTECPTAFGPRNQGLSSLFWPSNRVGSVVLSQQSANAQNLSSSFQTLGRMKAASPSRPGGLGLPGHLSHCLHRHGPDTACIWPWRNPGRLPGGGNLGAELWSMSWHSPRVMKGRVRRC